MAPKVLKAATKQKQQGQGQAKAKPQKLGEAALAKHNLKHKPESFEEKLQAFFQSNKQEPDQETRQTAADAFVTGLDSSSTQALWKTFERSRMAEGQAEEWDSLKGPGSANRKRALLKAWLVESGSCKSQHYREAWSQYSVSKKATVEMPWHPLQHMLQRYG